MLITKYDVMGLAQSHKITFLPRLVLLVAGRAVGKIGTAMCRRAIQ